MDTPETNKQIVEKTTEQPTEQTPPPYFRQVSPEKAMSEEYKSLYGYQSIGDLCDRVIELEKKDKETAAKYSRYIEVPDGKDPAKVQEFASKLGVPENADDYKITYLDREGTDKEAVSAFKKEMKDAMLTQRQANAVGNAIFNFTKLGLEKAVKAYQTKRDSFDATLEASYADIQSDTDRKSAAQRDKESFEGFLAESGLKEKLEKNGMAFDSDFVKAVASYARKHTGQMNVDRTPGGKTDQKKSEFRQYNSSDMERLYGRRNA